MSNHPEVKLIEMTDSLYESSTDPKLFQNATGVEIGETELEYLRQMLIQSRDFYASVAAHSPWVGYVVVDLDCNRVVGCCGYKGNPDERNEVEISYHTFETFEGSGFGTRMAQEMVRMAEQTGAGVENVIAHTLPEENASTSILRKCDFLLAGEIADPEDGTVWRWEKKIMPASLS